MPDQPTEPRIETTAITAGRHASRDSLNAITLRRTANTKRC